MKKDAQTLFGLILAAVLLVTGQGCGAPAMDGERSLADDPNMDAPGPDEGPVGGPDDGPDAEPDPEQPLPPATALEPELVMLADNGFTVSLWGTSENDLFLAGGFGLLAHFDGAAWHPFEGIRKGSQTHFLWLFGFASDDVYAGAQGGTVFHYDGDNWREIEALSRAKVVDLWGNAPDDVYAVTKSTLMHFDGFRWDEVAADLPREVSWKGITGHGQKNLVLIGRDDESGKAHLVHFDGEKWSAPALPQIAELYDVWSASPSETFAVGLGGVIVRFDGTSVTQMESGTDQALTAVRGVSNGEVYAVGHNTALRFDGEVWSDMAMPPDPTNTPQRLIYSLFALAKDSVFIGDRGLHRFDGEAWETWLPYTFAVRDIWASSPDDVLFAGTQSYRYDGFSVELEDFGALEPPSLRAAWGTGDSIYAVASDGEFFLYDGEDWARLATDDFGSFHDMFGTSENDVFAVGANGQIKRFDGTTWEAMESGTDSDLRGVWASSPDDVYAVGDEGTVLHYDGIEWSALFGSEDGSYLSLTGFDAEHIVTTNTENLIYFSDGVSWRPEPASGVLAVHGTSPNDVYGASTDGLRHYDGNAWTAVGAIGLGDEPNVFAVAPREVYASGDTGVFRFRLGR